MTTTQNNGDHGIYQPDTKTIAQQNDRFRQAIGPDGINPTTEDHSAQLIGQVFITPGIRAMEQAFVQEALRQVASYDVFTSDSDPWGLHEMGVIEVEGQTVWWKIDPYDVDYQNGSDEPDNPEKTRRVLTILFPSEY